MFLGLRDPDPLARGTDPDSAPDPDPSFPEIMLAELIVTPNFSKKLSF
jgi:hypothetical protein